MKTKRSAVLLSGLLLLGMLAVLSQTSDTKRPTCPALSDDTLQSMLVPIAWVKADWNANAKQWEIRFNEMDSQANLPMYNPGGPKSNVNAAPRKTPAKRHLSE